MTNDSGGYPNETLQEEWLREWRDQGGRTMDLPNYQFGSWVVDIKTDEVNGRLECTSLTVRMQDDARNPSPVTTSVLRQIPLAGLLRVARKRAAAALVEQPGNTPEEMLARLREAQQEIVRPSTGGRPPSYGPEHFLGVAEVYMAAHKSGEKPVVAVAAWGGVSRSAAAKWVAVARNKFGFLPPTQKGRAVGGPIASADEGKD